MVTRVCVKSYIEYWIKFLARVTISKKLAGIVYILLLASITTS